MKMHKVYKLPRKLKKLWKQSLVFRIEDIGGLYRKDYTLKFVREKGSYEFTPRPYLNRWQVQRDRVFVRKTSSR